MQWKGIRSKPVRIGSEGDVPEMQKLDPHGDSAHAREKILAEKKIPWLVLSFAIPTMISMMVNAFYNIVDRFWIGKMDNGAIAMAGIGITLPLTTIAFSFMALIGIGSTALISIRLGEKRREDAENVLGNCAVFSLILGTIIMVLGLLFAEPLLKLFGASEQTMPYSLMYIKILALFNTFNMIQFTMSSVMRGVGHPTWSVLTQVVGAITNMILDPIFIFKPYQITFAGVRLPIAIGFNMGVKGAAIATVIAQMVSFSIVLCYYTKGKSPVRLHIRKMRPRLAVLGKISAIGSSSFALQVAASLVQIVVNLQLAKKGGDLAVSAMTLVTAISMFCIMPIIGINQGAQPIIGYNYGAKNYERVRSAYFFSVIVASCFTVIDAIVIQMFPVQIISLFNNDPALVEMASKALRSVMFVLPVLGFQIVSANYFQFVGRSFVSLIMTLLRQIILLIPLYYILPHFWGLDGIWLANPIADAIAFLVTVAVISRELIWLSGQIAQDKIRYLNAGP
jgi:putative MATE family efflux protein